MSWNNSGWLKLNVGGQQFLTTMTTIMSCPNSMLAKMFDPESDFTPGYKEDDVYFLDANPKYFGIILDWLRYQEVIAEPETNLDNVAKVAKYFGVDELVEHISAAKSPVGAIGQWMDYGDASQHDVAAMKIKLYERVNERYESDGRFVGLVTGCSNLMTRIVKHPDGLRIVDEDKILELGVKCLSLDTRGRSAVWVPTKNGQVPPGAVHVKGSGDVTPGAVHVKGSGEGTKFIGRRIWYYGTSQKQESIPAHQPHQNGVIVVPNELTEFNDKNKSHPYLYISIGYVNENGVLNTNSTYRLNNEMTYKKGREYIKHIEDNSVPSDFEILCVH